MLKRNRPISPHLMVYSPTANLQRSIFHRFSAVFMVISLVLSICLIKFVLQCSFLDFTEPFFIIVFFIIVFLKWFNSLVLVVHAINGVQHLVTKF